ncbi:sensor histidine kinase [Nonomuraea phyllanthi]|uniref:Sensor histidine kinase n=1 Tax=Nonomuraea phyllanthi TaxID=2219224 RepID=A0A5C4VJS6_9ACTN|nr:histidine kinase [Nonomuraea phyllanthi]KAB8188974.1 sensor histidine kinase [Nonomuraea phyllanthi]QFY09539.1 sensor histidine kinase [Nonomuraea phyllanthi]
MRRKVWHLASLAFLAWPLSSLAEGGAEVWPMAGVAAFAALYLWIVCSGRAAWWQVAILGAGAAALTPVLGELWVFAAQFYVITAAAVVFERRARLAVCAVSVAAAAAAILPSRQWWIPLLAAMYAVALDAFIQLERARARAERLAVENERLRFARDMHDILGHNLSVMTLKSQLAARLAGTDPERARGEMRQVEELSRQALEDVRDAVAGYRALSLDEELANARRALESAGVRVEVTADQVPVAAQSLLAWVIREGATNVVRHSRAAWCGIRLGVADRLAYVEMADDGRGPHERDPVRGSGLRGLAERLEAAGGTLRCGAGPGQGYLLRAALPVTGTA